ncbi:LysR family transcriptional regulator (plasmid) [Rhizobium grahamii]|uniref:HTH-type transcriptional regulator TtuA n=1 Tax=Rhizobium grahamii TaxID=1120045 RepID=A0A5Q0CGF3_9HYPH|nr:MULTISPECIES: LysR family transcriptional regulator [Rhizobium]QFY63111.1 LysR family transcriptional regulator [Rhizobium grahamii]QRM52126.1 LysR family transcriptional regulator [Rhizobium sp. BG6]
MDNRAGEMEVFVAAAELQSFSAAGRRLGLSPSAVSKLITRIEDRLGTRLLVRSTRIVTPTPEGEIYLARAKRVLSEITDIEQLISSGGKVVPRGPLRINASLGFGERYLLPLVPDFLALYPEVELDISLTDGVIALIEERTDIAIRSGAMNDSALKARKLLESRRVIIASPSYVEAHGIPRNPHDLARHNCLTFNFQRRLNEWPFQNEGTGDIYRLPVTGNTSVNSGLVMKQLCLSGTGLGRVGRFHVQREIEAGLLFPVLEDFNPGDMEVIHAVYAGHEHLAARVRAFIDFLAARLAGEAKPSAEKLNQAENDSKSA